MLDLFEESPRLSIRDRHQRPVPRNSKCYQRSVMNAEFFQQELIIMFLADELAT